MIANKCTIIKPNCFFSSYSQQLPLLRTPSGPRFSVRNSGERAKKFLEIRGITYIYVVIAAQFLHIKNFKVETRKEIRKNSSNIVLWDKRSGWACVNWKTPKKCKSVPRLVSMIIVLSPDPPKQRCNNGWIKDGCPLSGGSTGEQTVSQV